MEKILKNISRREALKLSLAGLFINCDKKNPISPTSETDLETKLEFSSIPKDSISPYEPSNLGIKEKEWLNNKTLNVKSYVAINCAKEIENGSYKIIKDKINLIYKSPKCEICTTCMRTHELNYKFTNLEKRDYEFELQRIF